MPVKVSFMRPGTMGSVDAVTMGACRVCETLTLPGTTNAAALPGEIVVMVSTETGACIAAHGTTPSAVATAATAATSAGYGLPTGIAVAVAVQAGDKINVAAFA